MGNQLTVQSITRNLPHYKPDLSQYQLLSSSNNNSTQQRKWQSRHTSQRLLEHKSLVHTWLEFYAIVQAFAFRYNSQHLVAARFLIVEDEAMVEQQNSSGGFSQTYVSVFYEETVTDLSHFKEIPQQDAAYVLLQTLKGFYSLIQKIKFPFQPKQQMFHITADKRLKIWLSNDITQSLQQQKLRPLATESYMIHQLLQIIKSNIYFTTESQQNLQSTSYMPPIVIDELFKLCPENFVEAIQLTDDYLERFGVKVGRYMSCLKELSNEELEGLMKLSIGHAVQASFNQPHLNHHHPNHHSAISITIPSTPINPFVNHSSTLLLSRNLSMGNMPTTIINRPALNNSRSRSIKNKGLSLVKNEVKNYESLIHINKSPAVNAMGNKRSGIVIHHETVLPPRNSIKKVHFVDEQRNVARDNLMSRQHEVNANSRKGQTSNHHQPRGISITKKEHSPLKVVFNHNNTQQAPFNRTNNHCSTIKSSQQYAVSSFSNNCSTVSVGVFPMPQYRNDSKARTAITPANFTTNFSTISTGESFLPNQSLTRFQKELINSNNNSLNSSAAQFYECPRILVHSPKATVKIIRMDSLSTQEQANLQIMPITSYHQQQLRKQEEDRVKQQEEKQQMFYHQNQHQHKKQPLYQQQEQHHVIQHANNNPSHQQYHSLIEQNHSVFTDPKLYSYITENKSHQIKEENNVVREEKKKKSYIDYLANVQISQSLDYNTAEQLFQLTDNNKLAAQKAQPIVHSPHHHLTLNDFPTIEQIEQPANSYDQGHKQENASFLPINLLTNLCSNQNLSTVRRGYEESMVMEYKKFYDDTNRSGISPHKHYFSPLKRKNTGQNNGQQNRKYGTADNRKISPSKLIMHKPQHVNFIVNENAKPPMITVHSNERAIGRSPSPLSKVIYSGTRQPAINPILLQDMQRIRQNRVC